MKRFIYLALFLIALTLPAAAQSRTNTPSRPCAGSATPAKVQIARGGNISITPCTGGTITINGVVQPKVYRALLLQASTDASIATVLENSLGGTLVWTRDDEGQYWGTLTGAFPSAGKVFIQLTNGAWSDPYSLAGYRGGNNHVVITSVNVDGSVKDGVLVNAAIEILVYP